MMSKLRYGWVMVGVAALSYLLIYGLTVSAFGLYVVPVADELGLSRADMNTSMILMMLGGGLASPIVGRLVDRFPLRRIMLISASGLGISLAILAFSKAVWLSALVMLVPLPLSLAGAGFLGMSALVARWFEANRSRAMAISMLGMSAGGIVVPPVVAVLIDVFGWRGSLLFGGGAIAAILLPLFMLVRDRTRSGEPATGSIDQTEDVASQAPCEPQLPIRPGIALRLPIFWVILVGAGIGMGAAQAVSVSVVPIALEAGISSVEAAYLLSLIGAAGIGGKVLVAVVGDRIDRATFLAMFMLLLVGVNLILWLSGSHVGLLAAGIALGLCNAITPVVFTLVADRFGVASYGTVQGLMFPFTSIITAAAIRFAGEVFDRTGNYTLMFETFIILSVIAAILVYASKFFASPMPGHQLAPKADRQI